MSKPSVTQILIHISPPPRNVSESRDIYHAIKKFGKVELFKVVRFANSTNLPAPTAHVIFTSQPQNLPSRSFEITTTPPKRKPNLESETSSVPFVPRRLTITPLPSNFDHHEHIRKAFKAVSVNGIKGLRSTIDPEDVGREVDVEGRQIWKQSQYGRILSYYAGEFTGLDSILRMAKEMKQRGSEEETVKLETSQTSSTPLLSQQKKNFNSWRPAGIDTKREYHTSRSLQQSSGVSVKVTATENTPEHSNSSVNRKRMRPIPYMSSPEVDEMEVKWIESPANKLHRKLRKAIKRNNQEMPEFLHFRLFNPLPPVGRTYEDLSKYKATEIGWFPIQPRIEPEKLRPPQYPPPGRLKSLSTVSCTTDWIRGAWVLFRAKYPLPSLGRGFPESKYQHLFNLMTVSEDGWDTENFKECRNISIRKHYAKLKADNESTKDETDSKQQNNAKENKGGEEHLIRKYKRTVKRLELKAVKDFIETRYKDTLDTRRNTLLEHSRFLFQPSKWDRVPLMMKMEYKSLNPKLNAICLAVNPVPQLFTARNTLVISREPVDLKKDPYDEALPEDEGFVLSLKKPIRPRSSPQLVSLADSISQLELSPQASAKVKANQGTEVKQAQEVEPPIDSYFVSPSAQGRPRITYTYEPPEPQSSGSSTLPPEEIESRAQTATETKTFSGLATLTSEEGDEPPVNYLPSPTPTPPPPPPSLTSSPPSHASSLPESPSPPPPPPHPSSPSTPLTISKTETRINTIPSLTPSLPSQRLPEICIDYSDTSFQLPPLPEFPKFEKPSFASAAITSKRNEKPHINNNKSRSLPSQRPPKICIDYSDTSFRLLPLPEFPKFEKPLFASAPITPKRIKKPSFASAVAITPKKNEKPQINKKSKPIKTIDPLQPLPLLLSWNPDSETSIEDFEIKIERPAELELLELATKAEKGRGKGSSPRG